MEKNYKVTSPILHNGERVTNGTIELEPKDAAGLIECGALTLDTPPTLAQTSDSETSNTNPVSESTSPGSAEKLHDEEKPDGAEANPGGATTPPGTAGNPDGAQSDVVTPVDDERTASIKEAIRQLDPDNPEHFTNDNKPDVRAIGKKLGGTLTAAERDAAWESMQPEAEQDDAG